MLKRGNRHGLIAGATGTVLRMLTHDGPTAAGYGRIDIAGLAR